MNLTRKSFLGLAGAAAMALGAGGAAQAQEVTLSLHQFLPRQANVPRLILDKWIADVQEASGGRIAVDHFPSMQLGGRFPEMTMHARWLMQAAPDDATLLRFAIQAGIWGDEPELAEEAYARLAAADPRQAEAARRFIDNAPPAPPRR